MPSSFKQWQKQHKRVEHVQRYDTNIGTQTAIAVGAAAVAAGAAYLGARYVYNKATGAFEVVGQTLAPNVYDNWAPAEPGFGDYEEKFDPQVLDDDEDPEFFDAMQGPSLTHTVVTGETDFWGNPQDLYD